MKITKTINLILTKGGESRGKLDFKAVPILPSSVSAMKSLESVFSEKDLEKAKRGVKTPNQVPKLTNLTLNVRIQNQDLVFIN